MSTVETTFFVIFLTDVAQLPLALVAAITSVAGIADAITAMLAGVIIDKVNFKHGKYRALAYIFATICSSIFRIDVY